MKRIKTNLPLLPKFKSKIQNQENKNSPSPAACPLHPPWLASVNPSQGLRWNNLTVDPQAGLVIPLINITRSMKNGAIFRTTCLPYCSLFDLKSIQADRLIETDQCFWEGLAGNRLQQRQEST